MKWLPLLLLLSCEEDNATEGRWTLIPSPPTATAGTRCFVWVHGKNTNSNRYGGPVCLPPMRQCKK